MDIDIETVAIVAFFSMSFIVIGWMAPAVFATNAPADYYVEQNYFDAPDVSVSNTTHSYCFNRNLRKSGTGTIFTELYRLDENGSATQEVYSENSKEYFESGRLTVVGDVNIPNSTEAGTYRYVRTYRMQLQAGRVEREFTFKSEPFNVTGTEEIEPSRAETLKRCR